METLIQWNCNGCTAHINELRTILNNHDPFCIALQETHFKPNSEFSLRKYKIFRKDIVPNVRARGGVALLLKENIVSQEIPLQTNLQAVAARIETPITTTLCSIYLPDGNWHINDLRRLLADLPRPCILMGDFNAHSPMWGSDRYDIRGRTLELFIEESGLTLLNSGEHTYCNVRSGNFSAIDLTLCSPRLSTIMLWEPLDDPHFSDHFPLKMSLNIPKTQLLLNQKWIINKADWEIFTRSVRFPELPNDIDEAVEVLTSRIIEAANKSIPKTSGNISSKSLPWWNDEIKSAIQEKKHRLNRFRRYPTLENTIAFKKARAKARKLMNESQKKSWEEFVSSMTPETNIKEIWQKIRTITGHRNSLLPTAIKMNGNIVTDPEDISNALADHFESASSSYNYDPDFLIEKERQELSEPNFFTNSDLAYNSPFTISEIDNALQSCDDSAPGHDTIHYSMIKHLPFHAKEKLLSLYNKIWLERTYPSDWKKATIIPILKENRDCNIANGYRPISLTCCLGKVLERMVNFRLVWVLEKDQLVSEHQVGFRQNRSTTDALVYIEDIIQNAFFQRRHITAVMFDIEKAFDMTWRFGILQQLHAWGLRGTLPIFLKHFLNNRVFEVQVGRSKSSLRHLENGVPQGSVLSTSLFTISINFLLIGTPEPLRAILYVDDLTILYPHSIEQNENVLQREINRLYDRAKSRGFRFSPTKTTCIHFCRLRSPHDHPNLTIRGENITLKENIKLLGLIFDEKLRWKEHVSYVSARCSKILNAMRSVASIRWGANRETLIKMYKSLIETRLTYGAVAFGSLRKSYFKQLERIQLAAVRTAIGAFRTSPTEAILCDASITPLRLIFELETLKYAGKTITQPNHINKDLFRNNGNDYLSRPSYTKPARIRYLELAEKYNIPPMETPLLSEQFNTPPWLKHPPNINIKLTNLKKESTAPTVYQKLVRYELSKHNNALIIYTDGSKTQNGVGAAIRVGNETYTWSLEMYCSIFTAESYAIWQALLYFSFTSATSCVICTDSLSCVLSLKDRFSKDLLIIRILNLVHYLHENDRVCHLLWIPSHVGIAGNEAVDDAAREASNSQIDTGIPLPISDEFTRLRLTIRDSWQSIWDQFDGKLKQIKTSVEKWHYPGTISRQSQVALCRLRIGHTNLTHSYLLTGSERPRCEQCDERLTVEHILTSCQTYERIRVALRLQNTVEGILSNNESEVKKLIMFLRETNLSKKI